MDLLTGVGIEDDIDGIRLVWLKGTFKFPQFHLTRLLQHRQGQGSPSFSIPTILIGKNFPLSHLHLPPGSLNPFPPPKPSVLLPLTL